jgi:hypothetical protein
MHVRDPWAGRLKTLWEFGKSDITVQSKDSRHCRRQSESEFRKNDDTSAFRLFKENMSTRSGLNFQSGRSVIIGAK